jgi:hypothetical protein
LGSQSIDILKQKGFQIALNEQAEPTSLRDGKLELFRPVIPENLLADLSLIGGVSQPNILVVDVRVKVGEGGSWNPYSGAITSRNHYTILRAVLISTSEKKVLWHNEVQLRDIPRPKSRKLSRAMEILFQDIK